MSIRIKYFERSRNVIEEQKKYLKKVLHDFS